jgi:hypothetical protein
LLARARAAIGVGKGGPQVTSLKLTGTYWSSQVVITDMRSNERRSEDRESPIELRVWLPNRFQRSESPGGVFLMTTGFNGSTGFTRSEGLRPGAKSSTGVLAGESLTFRQLEVWQLLVGAVATPSHVEGVRISEAGPNTLQVTGPNNFKARLDLDPVTGRPAKIVRRTRFRALPPRTVFGPATEGGGGVGRIPDSEPEDDLTMTFADRRLVSGLWLPHLVVISGKGVDMNEYRFTDIVINPPFTAKDFE